MDFLWVQVLAERGGAHDIEEQDGDLLERLRRRGGQRPRERKSGELDTQRSQCGLGNCISEQGALSLERGDSGL